MLAGQVCRVGNSPILYRSSKILAPATVKALGWTSRVPAYDRTASLRSRYSTGHFTTGYTLSTEDKFEIVELCNRFDQTLNLGKQETLARFFSPDAAVNINLQVPNAPIRTVKGVKPIMEYFNSVRPVAAGNRHLTCNIVVEADGVRSAKVTAYRLLHKATNPPALLASGVIEDRLVNVNGEWKFSERNFIMDPPAPQPGS